MSYLKMEHEKHSVTLCYRPAGSKEIYLYQFFIENGKAEIYSIEKFEKTNIKGTSYKYFEVFHDISCKGDGKIYNYATNEYEEIVMPNEISERLNNYLKGFLVNCI